MRSFPGLVGYYRDYIPAFAEISAPLLPPQERKVRTSTMERSIEACVLTAQGVSATRTSTEAPWLDETVRSENRFFWSWSSSRTVTGKRMKVVPSRLRQQEVKPSRSYVPNHRERVPGSSVGY